MQTSLNPSTHRLVDSTAQPGNRPEHLDVLETMHSSLIDLQNDILEEDFPPADLSPHSDKFIDHLRRLEISETPVAGFYDINLLTGTVSFGPPMLDVLAGMDKAALIRFTEIFLLHETLHVDQKMYSSTHHGIGHASVVLEEMDYFADALAMATAISRRVRIDGVEDIKTVIQSYSKMAIEGLEMFDRTAAPEAMSSISEARLRRYLIWMTQYVRLLAARTIPEVHLTLFPRISVELEPFAATLDDYGEREFGSESASSHTQYFASISGRLARQGEIDGFSPAELFQAILKYDIDAGVESIRYVVMQNHEMMVTQL